MGNVKSVSKKLEKFFSFFDKNLPRKKYTTIITTRRLSE